MPTKTTNYGLVKPTPEEYYNVEIQNTNMDIIDTQIKADTDNISALNTSLSGKEDLIKNASAKTTLVDADTLPISDSAASSGTKKITFANLKTLLASLFLPMSGGTLSGNIDFSKASPAINFYNTSASNRKAIFQLDNSSIVNLYNLTSDGQNGFKLLLRSEASALALRLQVTNIVDGVSANYNIYGEHNITVSTSAPGSALAEGAQHQVY